MQIATIIPPLALVFCVSLAVAFLALLLKDSWGKALVEWVGKHALAFGFVVSTIAISGSLFYSSVMQFAPCDLCWWQRVLIFPQFILFLTALKFKDRDVFKYSWRLSLLSMLVSVYNIYIQMGGNPLVPCSINATCTKVYVSAYHGFVTIPSMSLMIAVALLLLAWANKIYEDRHA